MTTKRIDGLDVWANVAESALRWARRWRDNKAEAKRFSFPNVRADWLATCRARIRENAQLWRHARRERRRMMGLPDIGNA